MKMRSIAACAVPLVVATLMTIGQADGDSGDRGATRDAGGKPSGIQAVKKEPSLERLPGESAEAHANRILNQMRRSPSSATSSEDRGIDLFTKVWEYMPAPLGGPDGELITAAAELDIEGNLIIADNASLGALVQKLNGARNDNPSIIWQAIAFGSVRDIATDLDGDVYLALAGDFPGIQKISGAFGGVAYAASLNETPGQDPDGMSIVLDGDGAPFVLANMSDGLGTNRVLLWRVDPLSGATAWEAEIPDMRQARLAIDRRGDLYVVGKTPGGTRVHKFDGPRGVERWGASLDAQGDASPTEIVIGTDGSVVASTARDSGGGVVKKFNFDGSEAWTRTFPSAIFPVDLKIDRDGFVLMAANGDGPVRKEIRVSKLNSTTGADVWLSTKTSAGPNNLPYLCLDRLDNVYVIASRQTGPTSAEQWVAKYKSSNGDLIWETAEATEPDRGYLPIECIVDSGASVYTVGLEFFPVDPFVESSLIKFTQPFTDAPTRRAASPNLMLENQGVWAPGVAAIEEKGVIWELPSLSIDTNDIPLQGFFTIPIPFTDGLTFGGGPRLIGEADFTLGYKAEVNGGSADYNLPLNVKYLIPGFGKVFAGVPIPDILVEWEADPAARMTSNATPTVDAGLTAETTGLVYADVKLTAFSEEILNDVIVDTSWDVVPEDYIPPLHVLGLLGQFGFAPGEWFTVADSNGIFTGSVRLPKLSAKSDLNPVTNAFQTNVEADFLKLRVSLTQAIAKMFNGTLAFDKKFGNEDDEFYAALSAAVAQATFGANLGAEQTLDVVVTPKVRYAFSDGLPDIVQDLDQPISGVVLPPDGTLEITPFVFATATFANDTDMTLSPTAGFNTLELSVAADFGGIRLVGLSECILCIDEELFTVNIDVFNDNWDLTFPEVELAPLRVTGSTEVQPRLAAASRDGMSMFIYNQTAPSESQFNIISRDGSKMLLFGDRLFEGSQAAIKHHGRTECVPTSWINDNTLLIEVPNRFRLLPGVAKIWVESQFGISESIDMPIEYPVPRLATVNPNLWSADPDMQTLPVAVIDGGSTVGADTFIARRDYYITMRDELWNPNTVTGNPIYSETPGLTIPDGTGGFVSDTITIPDSGTIQDLNVRLVVDHTWNGDLIVRLSHNGVTRTLVDRPGQSGSGFGFDNDGFSIWLDDEGAGGAVETQDTGGPALTSPPNYTPNESLSAFDGQNRQGVWTIEISDNAGQDTGALVAWSLEFEGSEPLGAQAYFPCFNFDQMPAFPGVFFDGVPMERFVQPVDSGIHNIRLAERDYDTPRAVEVVLCNPGPGGGMSDPKILTIAAPMPVISMIEPSEVEPDTEDFEITVRGPKHVPYWGDYEEPKFGNFNAASVIVFDGMPLPTTFVGSAELRATVPASLISGTRNYFVTVETPDNGTSYFEELRNGAGDIVFQGLVPSGGTAAPMLFQSRFREPVIAVLSPDSTSAGNVSFNGGEGYEYNLTVCGENFRDQSVVLIDGQARTTVYEGGDMLNVQLLPEDVAQVGIAQITVINPDGQVSQPTTFEIVPEEMMPDPRAVARRLARESHNRSSK